MWSSRASICRGALFTVVAVCVLPAPGQQPPADSPTFRLTSNLVFLDVTVVDKKGHPVVTGLTRDDFTITEDKKPQRIFSFEAPEEHVIQPAAADESPEGMAPVTIFVLDQLNSEFEDFAYIRYEVRNYLMMQPEELAAPAELMVTGNNSLQMLQGFTRKRADLLYALDHLPAALPYKRTLGSFFWERFAQSIDALQQIALQNKGVPGRKNIVWVGHGGPNVNLSATSLTWKDVDKLKQYIHETANMLVDARVTLFVIYPGLKVNEPTFSLSALEADADIGETDPFAGDVNFGVLVDDTGGKLFFNRNDVDMLMKRSVGLGSQYYTLTYQPQDVDPDGKFRRIRVSLRNPNLRAMTKAGYFAPDKNRLPDPRGQTMMTIAEAIQSTIPFASLDVSVSGVVRHPDTGSADFTVRLKGKNLEWMPAEQGMSTANLTVAVASLDQNDSILASRIERLTIHAHAQDQARLATAVTPLALTIRVPRKTANVRVAMESEEGGRIGTADVTRKAIDASPEMATPEPRLAPAQPNAALPPQKKPQ